MFQPSRNIQARRLEGQPAVRGVMNSTTSRDEINSTETGEDGMSFLGLTFDPNDPLVVLEYSIINTVHKPPLRIGAQD